MEKVQGYKVFEPDFTCRGYQYEVGKTYAHKGNIGLCEAGFHFCKDLKDCFNYYPFNPENKVAQVVALGKTICGDNKSVTNKIEITKELSWHEVLELVNTGKEIPVSATQATATQATGTAECSIPAIMQMDCLTQNHQKF